MAAMKVSLLCFLFVWITATMCQAKIGPVTLSNGVEVPNLALGTGYHGNEPHTNSRAYNSTLFWLAAGGKHIDTAHWYDTEIGIGEALKFAKADRKDLFITTKLPGPYGYNFTREYAETSLKQLQTDYLDLFLFHVPSNQSFTTPCPIAPGATWSDCRRESWRAMEDLYLEGKIRATGVSNWGVKHLQDVVQMSGLRVPIHVNQVEIHPYLPTSAGNGLLPYCQAHNITIMAYAAVCGGAGPNRDPQSQDGPDFFGNADVQRIAQKYHATPAQVAIQWAQQQGYIADVRSEHAPHMTENLAGDFTLVPEDMAALHALETQTAIWYPDLDAFP